MLQYPKDSAFASVSHWWVSLLTWIWRCWSQKVSLEQLVHLLTPVRYDEFNLSCSGDAHEPLNNMHYHLNRLQLCYDVLTMCSRTARLTCFHSNKSPLSWATIPLDLSQVSTNLLSVLSVVSVEKKSLMRSINQFCYWTTRLIIVYQIYQCSEILNPDKHSCHLL